MVMRSKNVHVMSAGKGLPRTFQAAVKMFPISEVVIITDVDPAAVIKSEKRGQVAEAIEQMMDTCRRLDWPCRVLKVEGGNLDDIRDVVLGECAKDPEAAYHFNVTGGTKMLSLGLFLISLWVDGTCYVVDEGTEEVIVLDVPKMRVAEVLQNPNYEIVLHKLAGRGEVALKDLFDEMRHDFVPRREGDRKAKRSLSRGTLSKWTARLSEWHLVELTSTEGNDRSKTIRITKDGRFALKFIEASI